ncbi:maleylpyruvate isomerase family mycothiol-dependent enzyme [Streptacidiphilus fuscans]|uniref:Maleylpyruvate isomerase family mycothiol-dependent enzyme n=1 Tax=Streptacidiphilus fuscans TaxID=2789292 RepID=A0A931FIC8_9ACTN|nr:maleylpyruvate isomerase family mycothiol-dependent enzyme [Streptacidiphilus fuscans]MBF9072786.1 maleylpyruvate isomerase family mycothiol-dependent enzyme [Streptacidiphilus fuscans]
MATPTVPAMDITRTSGSRARTVNEAEIQASLAMMESLDARAWSKPTACSGWTVRDMVAHEVGQFEELPKPWLMITRIRRARHRHPQMGPLDGHNESQVEERGGASSERLVEEFGRVAPKGVRSLSRVPAPVLRRIRTSMIFPEGKALPEDSMEYLNSVLIARDTWMHRIDISDATGAELTLDAHDSEIMDQVLLDLALGWTGPPCLLELSGPAGGRFLLGSGPPVVTLRADAIDFARHLSGRQPRGELTFEGDADAAAALNAARVVF